MRSLLERLSNKPAPLLPIVPIAFIPLSDFEKTDVPLYTRTNSKEQIGKKDDFRINSCHMFEVSLYLILWYSIGQNISKLYYILPYYKFWSTDYRPNSIQRDGH